MLETICKEKTSLTDEDIRCLQETAGQLPLMAELTGGDVFIDCPTPEGLAVVVAQAQPTSVNSAYEKCIVGEYATPEKEPAVFHALRRAVPIRDIKATTQEQRSVRQDVTPIYNGRGECIGVLICEKNIRHKLLKEKKLEQLSLSYASNDPSLRTPPALDQNEAALREVHHRVKNNLQMVASMLSLQTRQSEDPAVKKILQENVARVLSIAAIHDILVSNNTDFVEIDSLVLLKKLKQNLSLFVPDGKQINICVMGDSAKLNADVAGSMSLVVNELIINALKHAFRDREQGMVCITFRAGTLFHSVTVSDDGVGFDPSRRRSGSLGMRLVDATVRDRLHGHLSIHSDSNGSSISFDFKN